MMKKFLMICAFIAGFLNGSAQTTIDNFTVGPYVVDYKGEGDVKYRLRDNIDLYEFFELRKDTVIVVPEADAPVKHAIQISGFVGANRYASKEIGVSGVWKQNCTGSNLYFNGGVMCMLDHADLEQIQKRNMIEAGVPLQLEIGKLNRQKASLFAAVGVTPAAYFTLSAKTWDGRDYVDADKDLKKSGFLVAPSLEFGGNIPVGGIIMRIGMYGNYKINCTPGSYDVYKNCAGRCFLGAKIGVVL